MLKSIKTRAPLDVIDGVLIRGQSLLLALRHDSLIEHAQRQARGIVAQAEREADAIRQYAAARGYREGAREAWQSTVPWLERFERHCAQAVGALELAVRHQLEAALHEPTVVEFVVRRVLDSIAESPTRQIRIFVPATMSGLLSNFSEWAADSGLPHVVVLPCEDERLAIECAEEVYLFDTHARACEWAARFPASTGPDNAGPSPEPSGSPRIVGRDALASVDATLIRQSELTRARHQSASSNTTGCAPSQSTRVPSDLSASRPSTIVKK